MSDNAKEMIDRQIGDLADWRGKKLAELRKLINAADPALEEAWKWGTAVWVSNGPVCAIAAFKEHVKINFFKGASLKDPKKLFNAGLDAKGSRAIDLTQRDKLDAAALKALLREAIALNAAGKTKKK